MVAAINHSSFDKSLINVENTSHNDLLTAFVNGNELSNVNASGSQSNTQLLLTDSGNGIEAYWRQANSTKPLKYFIDVEHFVAQQKTFPAPKQGAFNQALGKKTKTIIDATGGWGGDTLLMCSQGYQVTLVERNPVMALLLSDAMRRLAQTDWAELHDVVVPNVLTGNAIQLLASQKMSADCVYLDPMFPTKRKKSAATNKNMQLLQWLVGSDSDADELLLAAMSHDYRRIAVKRPDYALPLLATKEQGSIKPTTSFSSKLVHYDVYLKSELA